MSRKQRSISKNYKVFCEGDSEFNYIDDMRTTERYSIAIKPVNIKGGGYSNFLAEIKKDSNSNSLVKFIIIDSDKARESETEKKNLDKLIQYCEMENKSRRTPHIVIVNSPDFEYIACLHNPKYRGNNTEQFIIREMGYKDLSSFKADTKLFRVLNSNGNTKQYMLGQINKNNAVISHELVLNKNTYEVKVDRTTKELENIHRKSSNIDEFFQILDRL